VLIATPLTLRTNEIKNQKRATVENIIELMLIVMEGLGGVKK